MVINYTQVTPIYSFFEVSNETPTKYLFDGPVDASHAHLELTFWRPSGKTALTIACLHHSLTLPSITDA
jgi:hypothetical protein